MWEQLKGKVMGGGLGAIGRGVIDTITHRRPSRAPKDFIVCKMYYYISLSTTEAFSNICRLSACQRRNL